VALEGRGYSWESGAQGRGNTQDSLHSIKKGKNRTAKGSLLTDLWIKKNKRRTRTRNVQYKGNWPLPERRKSQEVEKPQEENNISHQPLGIRKKDRRSTGTCGLLQGRGEIISRSGWKRTFPEDRGALLGKGHSTSLYLKEEGFQLFGRRGEMVGGRGPGWLGN